LLKWIAFSGRERTEPDFALFPECEGRGYFNEGLG
jgi:hypothetical protein